MPNLETIKLAIIGALLLAVLALGWLYDREVKAFAEFKAEVKAGGEAAKVLKVITEEKHNTIVKEVSNAWNDQLPAVRSKAVDAYLRNRPAAGMLDCSHGRPVPGTAPSPEGSGGASEVGVSAACRPDDAFIADCAENTFRAYVCKTWAERLTLPVRE